MAELEECKFETGFLHEFEEELMIGPVRFLHSGEDAYTLNSVIQPSGRIIFFITVEPIPVGGTVYGPEIPHQYMIKHTKLMAYFRMALEEAIVIDRWSDFPVTHACVIRDQEWLMDLG